MLGRRPLSRRLALTALVVAAATPAAGQDPPAASQPTFRSRVTLVPLDVRVVDARGQPITDLRAAGTPYIPFRPGPRPPGRRRARRITPGDVVDRAGYETEMLEGSATSVTADTSAVTRGLQRNSPVMRDIENLYAAIMLLGYAPLNPA